MKAQIIKMILIITMFTAFSSCDLLKKNDAEESAQTVQDFNVQVLDLHDALENFVVKSQAYENAKFSTVKAAQTKQIMDAYFDAGTKFVAVMQNIQALQNQTKSIHLKSGVPPVPCSPMDFIPDATSGISPGLVKNVADLIAETKGDRDAIQAKFDKGEIDENTYNAACDKLKMTKTVKAVNTGIGAVLGTGAAMGAGLVVGATTLPAIATVTVVGVEIGRAHV